MSDKELNIAADDEVLKRLRSTVSSLSKLADLLEDDPSTKLASGYVAEAVWNLDDARETYLRTKEPRVTEHIARARRQALG